MLVEGGKGVFWTSPECHPRDYFAGSPLLFDFEQDLYHQTPADLSYSADVVDLGVAAGRQVVQVIQHIEEIHTGEHLTAKRVLVQRGEQFCLVYQQLYDSAQVVVRPASLFTFDAKPVLKTMDPIGMHSWNEEYWTFDADGPIHLDLAAARNRMRKAVPKGDDFVTYPFDLKDACRKAIAVEPGACRACGVPDGSVIAKLALRGSDLVATWTRWFPAGRDGTCPSD